MAAVSLAATSLPALRCASASRASASTVLRVAGIDLAERGERGRGAAPILLILAHDGGLKGDVLGVGPVLVAPGVLAVVLDGAIVLAEALAEDAGRAERVGGVAVLRVLRRQLLVEAGGLVVVGDVLLDAGGGEERLGGLGGRGILVGQLLVGGDRLVLLLLLLVDHGRVVERLGGVAVLRILVRHAQEEGGRLVVLAARRVLLARLHDRADDQLVEAILLVLGGEGLGLLEAARPALDVLVVLGLAERLQDAIAGGARVGIVGVALDDQAEPFDRLVVVAVVEEELPVLVDDGDDLLVVGEQRGVEVGRLAEQAIAVGDLALAGAGAVAGDRLADFFEGAHRLKERVLVVLADRLGLADGQVLAAGVLVLAELEVEDVGAQVAQLGGVGRVGEVGQVELIGLGGARVTILVDDLGRLLGLLRLGVHRLGQVADEPLGHGAGVLDRLRAIPVGGGPGAVAAVVAGQLAHLRDGGLGVAEELIPLDDLAGVVGGVAGVGIELDEQAIGLDGALVAGLVEDGVGQLLQDLARVLLAADLGEELEGVAGGLGVVFREELDQVVERLALQLLGALLLLLAAARPSSWRDRARP